MFRVKRYMRRNPKNKRMILTGPKCLGTFFPGKAVLGIIPEHIYQEGNVSIIGRSGTFEYEAAAIMKENISKPAVAYITRLTAPKRKTIGHAGAFVTEFGKSTSEKAEILSVAGVIVAENSAIVGETIARVIQ